MLAEFRLYVQVDEPPEDTVARMREFIRACIENLDGVNAVELDLRPVPNIRAGHWSSHVSGRC